MNNNIFNFKIGDAVAYFVFYIIIPTLITYINLEVFPSDTVSGLYCYVTILVSVLNNIYDGAGRWRNGIKARRNTKILAIWLSDALIGTYCLYVIFSVLIANNINCRKDWLLFIYAIVVLIAFCDMIESFQKNITLKKEIGGTNT